MKRARIAMFGMGLVTAAASMAAVIANAQTQNDAQLQSNTEQQSNSQPQSNAQPQSNSTQVPDIYAPTQGNSSQTQGMYSPTRGIYIGPGGISLGTGVGSYNLPFNNLYNRGGNYGALGSQGSSLGPAGLYWTPGVYWSPSNYWYGELGWPRFVNALLSGSFPSNGPLSGPYVDPSNLPPVPQGEELQRMNWTHLRRVMSFGVMQLVQGLDRLDTGSMWDRYLRVDRLQAVSTKQANVAPTREEVEELEAVLIKFDKTADDGQYAAVAGLWGFQAVHNALAEFLKNPAARYRHQLVTNSKDLDEALERFDTGNTWRQYLSLPTDLFVDSEDAEAAKSPPDPEVLRKALSKYDDVAKNPAYRMIAELPSFEATHASLARYLGRGTLEEMEVGGNYQTAPPATGPASGQNGSGTTDSKTETLPPDRNDGNNSSETPDSNPPGELQPGSGVKKPVKPSKPVEELVPPELVSPSNSKPVPAVREKK